MPRKPPGARYDNLYTWESPLLLVEIWTRLHVVRCTLVPV